METTQNLDMKTINASEGDITIPFRIRHVIEISFNEIKTIFHDISFTKSDIENFINWAESPSLFGRLIHNNEYEYEFELIPSDSAFIKRIQVPEIFIEIFKYALKIAETYQRERKAILILRITFTKEEIENL